MRAERRRTTAYLSPELTQRLRVHAAIHGTELSEVIAAALEAYLPASE